MTRKEWGQPEHDSAFHPAVDKSQAHRTGRHLHLGEEAEESGTGLMGETGVVVQDLAGPSRQLRGLQPSQLYPA